MGEPAQYDAVVIQLARLGDLAQTWPLLDKLNRSNGQGHTALVVDERLRGLAELFFSREHIISLPVERMLGDFASFSLANCWLKAKSLFESLRSVSARKVINLNYHSPAGVLAEAFNCDFISGARWRDIKNGKPSDAQLCELFRSNSTIRKGSRHLSDIWSEYADVDKSSIGVRPPVIPENVIIDAETLLEDSGLPADESPVSIVIGSGLNSRSWSPENYRQLALSLQYMTPIVLVGGFREENAAREILEDSRIDRRRVISLCGKTDLQVLAGILKLSRLVIGVDTGPLHLAAITGTKCLGIYYGSMNFRETGPYGEGNIVISPDDPEYPCHERDLDIDPERFRNSIASEAVIETAKELLSGKCVTSKRYTNIHRSSLNVGGLRWTEGAAFKHSAEKTDACLVQLVNG